MSIFSKLSFKDKTFKLREQAVLDATTTLLASKGFDLMTMDDVAGEVGISKPSLYKHFKSKEDLATEVMIQLLDDALTYLDGQEPTLTSRERLENLLEWALRKRLEGGLPFLPSGSPHVREILTKSLRYLTRAYKLHKQLGQIVDSAKEAGELRTDLPTDVILFSYYSRTCDPAVDYMQLYGHYSADAIVRHMLTITFEGIAGSARS